MSETPGPPTRLLLLAHSHAFGAFRVGSHHYARTFALSGAEVIHLSTPLSLAHRVTGRVDREAATSVPRGPYQDADGVTHLVPRTVIPRPYGSFRVVRELERHALPTTFDAVLIDQPLLWDNTVRSLTRRLLYRPTDLYANGVKARLQAQILAGADGIVATSDEVLRALGTAKVPTLVLPNGVDATHFTDVPRAPATRPARAVYIGALDDRFDWARVVDWARSHPAVHFGVAGPSAAPPAALPSNMDVLGPISYDALPALLHGARVGLLPLSDNPLNAGRSPMKLYEYLAAGLAVLTRETPVLREDVAAGVFTYSGPEDADRALQRALAHPSPNLPGIARAAGESWDAKAAALAVFIEALPVGEESL